MSLVEGTDVTLILHAVALVIMGGMIWAAAWRKRQGRFWRQWPPGLLFLWGMVEILDGLIYSRRYLNREMDVPLAYYEGSLSFVLNLVSLAAIVALIYRIHRGDVDEA